MFRGSFLYFLLALGIVCRKKLESQTLAVKGLLTGKLQDHQGAST